MSAAELNGGAASRDATFGRVGAIVTGTSWAAPVSVGVIAALLTGLWSWRPSLWTDEVATIAISTRTVPQIFDFASHRDLVHTTYYLFMHVWTSVFGIGQGMLRLPSTLAVGAAAAGVVLVARRYAGPWFAIVAGLAFAVLPRMTWAGTEARTFALAAAFAVFVSLALLVALQRGRWWWVLYAALALLGVAVYVYVALVVAAHALTVLLWCLRTRSWTRPAVLGLGTIAVTGLVTVPYVLTVARQAGQIHHAAPGLRRASSQVLVSQWFLGAIPIRMRGSVLWEPPFNWGIAATVMALACLLLVVVAVFTWRAASEGPTLLELALPWLVLPTVVLLTYSIVRAPLYAPRYLIVSAPAVALLVAAGLLGLRRRWLQVVAVAVVLVSFVPVYAVQRSVTAKQGSDWSIVAAYVQAEAKPGDVVLFTRLAHKRFQTTRKIAVGYPWAFADLRDVGVGKDPAVHGVLWTRSRPMRAVLPALGHPERIWLISDNSRKARWAAPRAHDLAVLAAHGYQPVSNRSWTVTRVTELAPSPGGGTAPAP